MKRDHEATESYRQERGEDSDFAPLEQAEEETTIAPIREGLIVPPRPLEEPTTVREDRRTARGEPTERSDL